MEGVRRQLKASLAAVESVLASKAPPRRLSDADVKRRAEAICHEVRARGGQVSLDQLRAITVKHNMPFTAVGALSAGGYLRRTENGYALARRGTTVVARNGVRTTPRP